MKCKDSPFYTTDPAYKELCDEGKVVEPPGLVAKALSVSKALASWTLAGFPTTSEDGRKEICQVCPNWNGKDDTCQLCGCALRWKRKMWTERCPDDPPRW